MFVANNATDTENPRRNIAVTETAVRVIRHGQRTPAAVRVTMIRGAVTLRVRYFSVYPQTPCV